MKPLPGLIAALTFVALVGAADAFEVSGLHSGVTLQDFQREVGQRGQDTWPITTAPDHWAIGDHKTSRVDGTATFCDGRLASLTNVLDFDQSYVPTLKELTLKYGQPKSVSVFETAWSGPGGGMVQMVNLLWYSANDRIRLSVIPEGRDVRGNLRYERTASVSYTEHVPCVKDW